MLGLRQIHTGSCTADREWRVFRRTCSECPMIQPFSPSNPSLLLSTFRTQLYIRRFYAPNFDSLNGYLTSSSFLIQICFFFFEGTCSTQTCFALSFINVLMYRGSHNSLATPRSLQQRINAFDLQPSVAVGMPSGEK